MSTNSFEQVLADAIDGGLSCLGNTPREAIFHHLETSFEMKKQDIPLNLAGFLDALERIFGPGTPYIERLIIRRLYEELGLNTESSEKRNLVTCVKDLKNQLILVGDEKR